MKKSATILEIVIAISIILLLAAISVPAMQTMKKTNLLNQGVQTIISTVRTAQSRTTTSQNLSVWGLYFATDSIVLFEGSSLSTATTTETFKMPDNVFMESINLISGTSEIYFLRPQGRPNTYGNVVISLTDGSLQKILEIAENGWISIGTSTVLAMANPNQDSRHIHIPLFFDVRTKSDLILVFHNPPSADVIETVPVSECVSAIGVFDCTKTVNVGGSNQVIRINSHYIDPANTTLSINRDLRYNNKAVDVYFDSVFVIGYGASGIIATSSDIFVGVPEIQ